MPLMTYSDTWVIGNGFAGFPRWTYTVDGTYDPDTLAVLERYSILESQVKFTLLPNETRLVAMPLNGQTLVTVDIQPTNWARMITGCVKVGPVGIHFLAGVGGWTANASFAVARYTVMYQQLELNHYVRH